MVFRCLGRRPDIVAGEIDVLPSERREVSEKVVGNVLGLAHCSDRAAQIAGVPQDDGRDEEIEAGSAVLLVLVGAGGDEEVEAGGGVLLVLVGAVADFAEPMNEDGTRQAVTCLALIELAARVA